MPMLEAEAEGGVRRSARRLVLHGWLLVLQSWVLRPGEEEEGEASGREVVARALGAEGVEELKMLAAEGVPMGEPVLKMAEEVVVLEVRVPTWEEEAARELQAEEEGRRPELRVCGTWAEEAAFCRWVVAASSLPVWEGDPAGRG